MDEVHSGEGFLDREVPAFGRAEWTAVIAESLVKRDLVALCGRLDVEFPGRRLDSVSELTLADPLAEIVLEGPGPDRDLIVEKIRSSNHSIAERVRQMPLEELEVCIADPSCWPTTVTPARLLWALQTDPRAGARKASGFFKFVRKSAERALREAKGGPPAPKGLGAAAAELKEAAQRLADVTDAERRRAEREGKRVRDLEGQVAALKGEIAERDDKLAARKSELEEARSEAARAGREADSLRSRLKAQPPESWEAERRRLEHELKSLRAELEHEREKSRVAVEAAERRAAGELAAERSRVEEARGRAEAAEKEAAWLRERLKTPVKPPEPPRRDPERVAVFAEVQSLYPHAASLHGRIDYRQLLQRALSGRRAAKVLAYVLDVPGVNSASFKQALQGMGYQVRAKAGREPRLWTAGLEADLKDAARTCGRIVVATANPELATVLAALVAEGVHVTLFSFGGQVPEALRSAASESVTIGSDLLRPLPARS
jgi:hypothetical protein